MFYIFLTHGVICGLFMTCEAGTLTSETTDRSSPSCAGTTFQPACPGTDEIIAVESIQHGTKLTTTCALLDTSDQCCSYDSGDCLLPYAADSSTLHADCSGKRVCTASDPVAVDASSCGSGFPGYSHYYTMEYYCLPGSRTSKMCTTEAKSETGTLLYLKNQDYPQQIRGDETSCTCSIEAKSCDSQVKVYILHLDLSNGSPGVCNPNQKIIITDKGTPHTYTCADNNDYMITLKLTSTSNYITIQLNNPDGVNDGHLWFGFEATNPVHELTLDCPAKNQTLCLDCPEIIVDDSSHAPETATSTYTTGTTVTYTCNAGFERTTGDEQITCGTDGTWIGTAPTCTVKTCAPVSVANSAVTPVKSTYNYDDFVTYTCNVGYENTGGPLSRTCTDINTWSGSVPVCTIKTCAPVSVANSAVTPVKSTYNYDDSVTYTCNVGYENTGGPLSRTCTDTNTWSGSVPVCTTNCPGLSHPPNGQVSPTIDVSTGQTATYTCSNGYILDGSRTRTCQGDGSWSGSEPTCTTRGGCPTGAIVAIVTAAVVVIVSVIVVVVCKHDNRYKRIWKQIKDKLNSSKRYEDPEKPQQTKETIVSEQKLNDASVTELDNVKNQHIEQTLVIKDIGVQVKSKSVMVEPEKPNKLEAPSSSSNFRGAQLLHFNLNGIRSPDPATPALYPDLSSLSLFSDVYPVPDDLPQVPTNMPQVLSNTSPLSSGIQQASSEFSSTASQSIPVSTDVSPVPSSLPIASNELLVQSRALTPVFCH